MSIPDNFSPALGSLTIPLSAGDAAARITEYTIEHPVTGLIGLAFSGVNQFQSAMIECGWTLGDIDPFMSSKTATTLLGTAKRKGKIIRFLLHSFGEQNAQNVQVINCAELAEEIHRKEEAVIRKEEAVQKPLFPKIVV
jgi:hypothetical protein